MRDTTEQTEKDQNPLASASIPQLMVKFAVPSIVAMLVSALYNIVDQLFIGHAVGTLGNAATNIAFPLSTMCCALALLFGIGGASCFNLSMGKGEKEEMPYYMGNSVTMLVMWGIVLMAITLLFTNPILKFVGSPDEVMPYAWVYVRITAVGFPFLILTIGGGHLIRADGSPKMTMVCNMLGAVVNTVLDALFVLVFDWGMAGAAYATIIGQIVSAIVVICYLYHCKSVKLRKCHFLPKWSYTSKTAAIGIASFINQIAMMVVQIVLNNCLRKYGAMSEFGESIPIACAGIIMKVNQIVFAFVIGLGQGTQPIESFNYGAGRYGRVREAYCFALATAAAITIVAFTLFQIFPRQIMAMFGNGSEEYFSFGVSFFRIFLFFTWLNCIQPITSTFFTSIGKPVKGAILALTKQIIFFLPLLVVLPHFFGIYGILYTGPIADIMAVICNVLFAVSEFKLMRRYENEVQCAN